MSASPSPDVITRVSWSGYRVPFRASFRAAHGALDAREGFIVEVESTSGMRGVGEAAPLPSFGGGSLAETAAALDACARASVGRAPGRWWPLPGLAAEISRGSLAAARCGLETALADLASRDDNLSIGAWLAARAMLPPPRNVGEVPANAIVDLDSVSGVADAVVRALADGFSAAKLKVGSDPAADAARVHAARRAGGPDFELRVDANRAWSSVDALSFLHSVEPAGVALCEEPLKPAAGHFEALAALRRQTTIPLAVDESCPTADDLADAIDARAAATVVVKPMVTGLAQALTMLMLARKHGLRVIVTTTFDSGVATALSAHLASLLPAPIPACGLATLDHLEHPLVLDPPILRRGSFVLPSGPGLGVVLDRVALARYASGVDGEVSR